MHYFKISSNKLIFQINIYNKHYGEMVDFGKSDKMIKISGKVDKPNTYNGFSRDISFFILGRTSPD